MQSLKTLQYGHRFKFGGDSLADVRIAVGLSLGCNGSLFVTYAFPNGEHWIAHVNEYQRYTLPCKA